MESTLPFLSFLTFLLSFLHLSPSSSAQIMQGIFLSSFYSLVFFTQPQAFSTPLPLYTMQIMFCFTSSLSFVLLATTIPFVNISAFCFSLCAVPYAFFFFIRMSGLRTP